MLWLLLSCAMDRPSAEVGPPRDLTALVDPRIGTGGVGYRVGCAYPGAARPFGLVKLSPDTADISGGAAGFYHGGGYHADDELIRAFSHLHGHGIGIAAYGMLGVMPVDGFSADRIGEAGHRARFDKASETASAGRYAVTLTDDDGAPTIDVALSATVHTGLHRYTFRDAAAPTLLLDLGHGLGGGQTLRSSLRFVPESGAIEGSLLHQGEMGPPVALWFVALPSVAPTSLGVWAEGAPLPDATEVEGVETGAWLSFDPADLEGGTVSLRVAVSPVDLGGAWSNLLTEHSGFDLEADAAEAEADWETWLGRFSVWGGDDREAVILATALYHTLLMPTLWTDHNGRYASFDGTGHDDEGVPYFTDFSLWDTYRTAHPLYTLLWPEAHEALLRSLARMAEEGGALPRWPLASWDGGAMLGSPAQVVVGEAWQKGLLRDPADPDRASATAEALLDAALAVATGAEADPPYGGRPDVSTYDALGYYPSDEVGASVAWSQEVSIADAALLPMAEDLGRAEGAAQLAARADGWQQLYDPAVGFFHGRRRDGSFEEDFDEVAWLDEYTEGNARQYLWLAPQAPEDLFALLGGPDVAAERLEEFMAGWAADPDTPWPGEWYWHGNEPDLHAPWLLALAGHPDRAAAWVDAVARQAYSAEPDGLAGNDDGGTLSAWFVFASLGFYPLAGTDRYILGQPRFPLIQLPAGDGLFTISQVGEGPVAEVWLNGQRWEAPDFPHAALIAGGSLVFVGRDEVR